MYIYTYIHIYIYIYIYIYIHINVYHIFCMAESFKHQTILLFVWWRELVHGPLPCSYSSAGSQRIPWFYRFLSSNKALQKE